ncbi:MAG: hypothetical protein GDA56_10285 [Hormoscilla sp. GM7CHS1pb]|nr:hypothetical protein [Hormoscilla sp. GM7CHS1pb]
MQDIIGPETCRVKSTTGGDTKEDRRNPEMMEVQVLLPRCRGKSIAPAVASRPETPTHVMRGSDMTGWVLPDAMASIRKAGRKGVNDW